jgi:hypothetical protein
MIKYPTWKKRMPEKKIDTFKAKGKKIARQLLSSLILEIKHVSEANEWAGEKSCM